VFGTQAMLFREKLKSVGSSAIEVNDPSLELPISVSKETVEDAVVVMLTGPQSNARNEAGQNLVVENTPALFMDGIKVLDLELQKNDRSETVWRIAEASKKSGFVISDLVSVLKKAKEQQESLADLTESEFDGKVVIVADKQTPYRVLMDVLVSCGQAGFGEFRFAIIKDESA
jgi:hypothetical protein